jgi:polyhydroxyalkanoate synthesis regulator phasin
MAKRRPITREMPDAVREAVDRTVQATIGSAQLTRGRAQDAVDELVRTAGSSAEAVRERVVGVYEDRRPVSNEDLGEIRAELRKISRRLAAIEKRLDEGGSGAGGAGASGGDKGRAKRGSRSGRGSSTSGRSGPSSGSSSGGSRRSAGSGRGAS